MANEFIARKGLIVSGTTVTTGQITATSFSGAGTGLTGTAASLTVGNLTGGTTNYIPIWTSATAQSSSNIYQSAGNIAIGTTTTNGLVHIFGPTVGSGRNLSVRGDVVLGSGASLFFDDNYNYGSGNYIRNIATNTQVFVTSGTERLRIDSSGGVGIGTQNPSTTLHVQSAAALVNIIASTNATAVYSEYRYNTSTAVGYIGNGNGLFTGYSAGAFGLRSQGDILLGTNGDNVRVRIDSSGNVGIGSTTPQALLHAYSTTNNAVLGIFEQAASSPSTTTPVVRIIRPNNINGAATTSSAALYITDHSSNVPLQVSTHTSASLLTVSGSGNVGIGTSSPATPLDVSGGVAGTGGWNRTATLTATYPTLIFNSNGTKWGGIAYDYSTGMRFWTNANNNDIFTTTPVLTLLNGGNVGIGSTTPNAKLEVNGNTNITGSLTITGTVSAREFYTQLVSSSIIYQSGSTKFGDTSDDVMSVTGSLRVQGSITGSLLATNGIVSSSTASSPSQGTVRVTINGVNTDVDTGLQTGDSPSFVTITSTQATGTAPFTVASTTAVTNLNADYLDGQHGTYYTTAGNLSGTIPSSVLGNSTVYIGTTAITLNRSSASQTLTGVNIDGVASGLSNITDWMLYRGSVNVTDGNYSSTAYDNATGSGFYLVSNPGQDSRSTLVFNPGGSTATVQQEFNYGGGYRFRNKTDSATWTAWKTVLTSANYNSYAPTLTGTGASGNWAINVTGTAANITAYTINQSVGTSNAPTFNYVIFKDSINANTYGFRGLSGVITCDGGAQYPTAWNFQYGNTSTSAMYISSSGYVGIGTTSPNSSLDVRGVVRVGAGASVNDMGANSYAVISTATIGHKNGLEFYTADGTYNPRAWIVHSTSVGSQLLTFNSVYSSGTGYANFAFLNGNVGIGTTSPNAKLHVSGGISLFNSSTATSDSNSGIRIVSPIATTHYNWMIGAQQNVSAGFEITPSTAVGGTTFSTPVLLLTAGGNVGIGTSSPATKVEISDTAPVLRISGLAGSKPQLQLSSIGVVNWALRANFNNASDFTIYQDSTERVRVDSSGNVIIASTTPSTNAASVIQKFNVNTGATDKSGISIQHGLTAAEAYTVVGAQYAYNNALSSAEIRYINTALAGATMAIGFATHNGSSLGERVRITDQGNVGIGTTSPAEKVHIDAGSGIGIRIVSTGYSGIEYHNTNGTWKAYLGTETGGGGIRYNSADSQHTWYNNSSAIMRLNSTGLGVNTTSPTRTLTVNGSANITGSLDVTGAFTAQTKSFKINHQTLPGKSLVYGVLEGPEHAVQVRGKLTNNNTIILPPEWDWLVDHDSITVQLTPIGSHQNLYVEEIVNGVIFIKNSNLLNKDINCYYLVHATRKDVEPLNTVQ